MTQFNVRSRESTTSKMKRPEDGRPWFDSWLCRSCPFATTSRPALWSTHPASSPVGNGVLPSNVNWSQREANHSRSCGTKLNACNILVVTFGWKKILGWSRHRYKITSSGALMQDARVQTAFDRIRTETGGGLF